MSRNGSAVVCAIGAERLEQVGHLVSPPTVARLLRKLGYSLRVNAKKQEGSRAHPERQQQCTYLQTQKDTFGAADLPIRSRDTKKKELIGNAQECGANVVSTCRRGECA
jgi:Rhodopirellula transposase DDE domain